MTWTAERIDELTRLWSEGQSASAIGKQLGISKNAVVGKAHRLKLPSRPSPIRKQEAGTSTPARKRSESLAMPARSEDSGEQAETVPQAPAQASQDGTASTAPPPRTAEMPQPAKARTPRANAPKRPEPVTRKLPQVEAGVSNRTCQWPIGDPSQPDFHFCESPAAPGRPYCAEHCAMAYITRSKDKGSEAA